jgi:hypothetical protein
MVAMAGDLFESTQQMKDFAKSPGPGLGTREEIECARVEEIHGQKGNFSEEVRHAVKERYYALASDNPSHFLNPKEGDIYRPIEDRVTAKDTFGGPVGAGATYRDGHMKAIREAVRAGKAGDSDNEARLIEGFSEHFLTDAFSSGHARVPRTDVKEYWHAKVPMFWTNLRWYMAEKIAWHLNDNNFGYGILTVDIMISEARETIDSLIAEVGFPPMSFGDVISGALHDFDNVTGVWVLIEGAPVKILGDGQLKWADQIPKAPPAGSGLLDMIFQGLYQMAMERHTAAKNTRDLAIEAVKRSIDEVTRAYQLGQAGQEADKVIETLLAGTQLFAGETMLPEVLSDMAGPVTPGGEWQFNSAEELLADSHMQDALKIFAAEKAGEIGSMGAKLSGAKKAAFEGGFLGPLKAQPLKVMQEIIDYVPHTGSGFGGYGHDEDDRALEYYAEAKSQNALGGLTVRQKIRIVHELLSGATIGDEETAILELLDANPGDAPQIIEAVTWEWLWDDLDGDEHIRFVRKCGPVFWPTQGYAAKYEEVSRLAAGYTSWIAEEAIMIILRTCTQSEVRAMDAQFNLDFDLTGKNQDELDEMLAAP